MSFDLLDRFEIAGIARDELLLAAANAILLIVSVILVARRRKCQPLRFRDPYLLIATVTASFLSNFGAMTINRIEYPHCAIAMITFLPLLSSMVLICARFWKLFLASQITQARLTNQLESWILRHPRVRSSRWLWQVIVLLTGLLTLVELGLGLSSPVCARSDAVYFWTSFLMVAYWLVIGALTWKLRRLQDGFFVARELKMLGVVIFLSNLVVIPVVGGEERRQPPTIPLIISSILQLIIQTWYPLWKSLKMAPNVDAVHDRDESNGSRTSLAVLPTASTAKKSGIWSVPLTETSNVREVLRHPVGFGVMKLFLTLEFSIENLLCWQQLDENRRERRPSQVQAHFNAIYETFVRPGSPNEVNISAQLKKHFENVIHGKPVDLELIMKMKAPKVQTGTSQPDAGTDIKLRLLKQLYRDIIKVMQMDSFQRFRQTAEFQDLIRSNADIRVVTAKS